jgi:hypothetical protein
METKSVLKEDDRANLIKLIRIYQAAAQAESLCPDNKEFHAIRFEAEMILAINLDYERILWFEGIGYARGTAGDGYLRIFTKSTVLD